MFSFDLLQAFHLLPLGFTVNAPSQLFVVVLIRVCTQNTQLTDTRVLPACTAERVWIDRWAVVEYNWHWVEFLALKVCGWCFNVSFFNLLLFFFKWYVLKTTFLTGKPKCCRSAAALCHHVHWGSHAVFSRDDVAVMWKNKQDNSRCGVCSPHKLCVCLVRVFRCVPHLHCRTLV